MSFLIIILLTGILNLTSFAQKGVTYISPQDMQYSPIFVGGIVPKVTGLFVNFRKDEIDSLKIVCGLIRPQHNYISKKYIDVNADGTFTIVLADPFPFQQIWLSVGERFMTSLYIANGLHIEIDGSSLSHSTQSFFTSEAIRYSGADAEMNTILGKCLAYDFPSRQRIQRSIQQLRAMDKPLREVANLYKKYYDSLDAINHSFFAKFPSNCAQIISNENRSSLYTEICNLYRNGYMPMELWEEVNSHTPNLISQDAVTFSIAFLSYLKYSSINMLSDPDSFNFTTATTGRRTTNNFDTANILLHNGEAQQSLLSESSKKSINEVNFPVEKNEKLAPKTWLDSLYAPAKADYLKLFLNKTDTVPYTRQHIFETIQTSWVKLFLKNMMNEDIARLNNIQKVLSSRSSHQLKLSKPILTNEFGANFYRVDHKDVLEFVASLRQRFEGKGIIIDRWATWCLPCIQELPHSKKIQELNHPNAIFVYLCTESGTTETEWLSTLTKMKIPGFHFLISEKMDLQLEQVFGLEGYPSYIIINSSGQFVPNLVTRISQVTDFKDLDTLLK